MSLREKLNGVLDTSDAAGTRLLSAMRERNDPSGARGGPLALLNPKVLHHNSGEQAQELGNSSRRVSAVKGLLSSLEVDALEADRRRRAVTGSVLRYMQGQQDQWPGQSKAVRKDVKDARKMRPPPGEWALRNLPSGEADKSAPSLTDLAATLNTYRRRLEDESADPAGAEDAAALTSRALLQAELAHLQHSEAASSKRAGAKGSAARGAAALAGVAAGLTAASTDEDSPSSPASTASPRR